MGLLNFGKRLMTVVYLMTHRAVPWGWELLPIMALAYIINPRDLFFDFRTLGYLDDLAVAGLLLTIFTSKGREYVSKAERVGEGTIPAEFEVIDDSDSDAAPGAPPEPDESPQADIR